MRMRNPKYKNEVISKCNFLIKDEINFSKEQPLHIEIGMGKGNFILNMAINNPDINFIGFRFSFANRLSISIKSFIN